MTVSFELSPELREYENRLRDWSVSELRPHARPSDTRHQPPSDWREIIASCPVRLGRNDAQPDEDVPPAFSDGELLRQMVQYEAVNYGDTWAQNRLGGGIGHVVVKLLGTPEQAKRWYEPIMAGGGLTAFGLTEPGTGSDTSQIRTRAVRDGDSWIINGTKVFCSHGASAEYVVVFTVAEGADGGRESEAFVVERGTPGFEIVRQNEDKLGLRSWETSQIAFENCVVPAENRLGHGAADAPSGTARMGALSVLNNNRPNVGAMALGVAQGALDLTRELLGQQQAGFRPDRWALVTGELDTMDAAVGRMRRMCRRAQWMRQRSLANRVEASMAKAVAPPTSERIVRRCMQLLGPDGASTDLLLEKWYRDLKILDIFEGTGQIQRRIIARELAKQARRG